MEKIYKFERIELCKFIPEILEYKVLYISEEFGCIIHLCPCGCGNQIVISIKPKWYHGWEYNRENNLVTLSPSLLNTSCPNHFHYFIKENNILWC